MIFFTHWAPRIVTALAGLFTNQVLQQSHSGIWVTVSKTFQADKFDKAGLSIKSTKLAIFSYWKQGIHPLFRLLFLKLWNFCTYCNERRSVCVTFNDITSKYKYYLITCMRSGMLNFKNLCARHLFKLHSIQKLGRYEIWNFWYMY